MSFQNQFNNAFDLSSLTKKNQPAQPIPGVEATVETLPNELMPLSNIKPASYIESRSNSNQRDSN